MPVSSLISLLTASIESSPAIAAPPDTSQWPGAQALVNTLLVIKNFPSGLFITPRTVKW